MNKKNEEKFKKEILELEKLQGRERGADVNFLVKYVKLKEGEEKFKKLEDYLSNEHDFYIPSSEKLSENEWIPESIPHIIMIAIIRFFDWTEKDVFEMGKNAMTYSRTLKTFIKYFISVEQTIKKIANEWNKYYTEGSIVVSDFNKNKKEAILKIKNFKTHPLLCVYLSGIMERILELSTGSKNIKVKETRCVFKGDDCHEFKLKW